MSDKESFRFSSLREKSIENAIQDSVPPFDLGDIIEAEKSIANLTGLLKEIEGLPYLKGQIIKSVQEMLSAANNESRLSVWPWWPQPWPWPPVLLRSPPTLSETELNNLTEPFLTAKAASVPRIFPAITAGLALGYACAKIYKKYARSGEGPNGVESSRTSALQFATDYMSRVTLDVAQAAVLTRADYETAIIELAPATEIHLSDLSTSGIISKLAEEAGGPDRYVAAVVFGVCFVIGFLAEA